MHQKIVMPLHPRTKKAMHKYGITTKVQCIDPIGYIEFIEIVQFSYYR